MKRETRLERVSAACRDAFSPAGSNPAVVITQEGISMLQVSAYDFFRSMLAAAGYVPTANMQPGAMQYRIEQTGNQVLVHIQGAWFEFNNETKTFIRHDEWVA